MRSLAVFTHSMFLLKICWRYLDLQEIAHKQRWQTSYIKEYFILGKAKGQSHIHCKIKETLLIKDLKPILN